MAIRETSSTAYNIMLTTEITNLDVTEVGSVQEKNEEKINREKHEICQLTSILKDNKQELEFLKDHGSNNQLFLTLRKQITNIQKFRLTSPSFMNSVSGVLLSFCTR
jgi:hypothetical protein